MSFLEWIKLWTRQIEEVGRLEQYNQRILQGRCIYCGLKLPANHPLYYCDPPCVSHLADPCKEEEE